MRALIEKVLAMRKPRVLELWELEHLEAHTFQCMECLRAHAKPQQYKRCDAMRVWMTEAKAYTFEINADPKKCKWCKTLAQHKQKVANQRAQNPELHRRPWGGVHWAFMPDDGGHYIRMQWCYSTYQVVRGQVDNDVEELIYHTYSDCE